MYSNNSDCILSAFQIFGLISLLLGGGGGGGQAPKCTGKKLCICNVYARASEASERLRNICIFRSQNKSVYIIYTINAVVWHFK